MAYDVEEHYDKIASSYEEFEKCNPRKHILIKQEFVKVLGNLGNLSVLDLGCGGGFFSLLSKQLGARYVLGVDISRRQLKIAKENSRRIGLHVNYKKADIAGLKLDKKFDVVVAGFVFNYAQNLKTLSKHFEVTYKHLKEGGKLFAILCNPQHPLRKEKILYRVILQKREKLDNGSKLRCEFYDKKGKLLSYDYKFLWSKRTVESILNENGFRKFKWINYKNQKRPDIPSLPSTNVILFAAK